MKQGSSVRSLFDAAATLSADRLPAFLRVLLTTDGTVTQSLEAFFWESIEVVSCGQRTCVLDADEPLLRKVKGESILRRQVRLIGRDSARLYAHADSSLDTDALPQELREGLASGALGIGELLRGSGFETYREIIDFGELPEAVALGLEGPVVWRRYRIRMAGRPLILIRELFPVAAYQDAGGCGK